MIEKEKKSKSIPERITPYVTMILSIITLIQIIINFVYFLVTTEDNALQSAIVSFIIGILITIGCIVIFLIVLYVGIYIRERKKRKNEKSLKKAFKLSTRIRIDYDELKSIADEVISKIQISIDPDLEGVSDFYYYVGLLISIWEPIVEGDNLFISDEISKLYLCKFEFESPDKRKAHLMHSEKISETINVNMKIPASFNFKWDHCLKELIDEGWTKLILESNWKNQRLVKYCLSKNDNFLLIYHIELI